jgi:hypothetical protein
MEETATNRRAVVSIPISISIRVHHFCHSILFKLVQLRLSSNHDRYKVNGLGCGLSISSDRNTEQMEPLGGRDLCLVNFLVSRGLMIDNNG